MRQLYVRWIPYIGAAISLVISPCAVANPASTFSNNGFESQDLPSQRPLVPNPKIKIDGKLVPAGGRSRHRDYQPDLLPRAVAPPVGDISISNTDSSPTLIDLGTQEKVRRLVLRDASVREVLSMLGRLAKLDIVFVKTSSPKTPQTSSANANDIEQIKASLDIEDKPLQEVFNQILRAAGLQAYREGNTVFVGVKLPNEARNVISRALRLNQVTTGVALNYLVALGAESAIGRDRTITNVQAVPVSGGGTSTPTTQTQTTTETRVETQRIDFQDGTPSRLLSLPLPDSSSAVMAIRSRYSTNELCRLDWFGCGIIRLRSYLELSKTPTAPP